MEAASFESANALKVGVIELHTDAETVLRAVITLVDEYGLRVHHATNTAAHYILIDDQDGPLGDSDD